MSPVVYCCLLLLDILGLLCSDVFSKWCECCHPIVGFGMCSFCVDLYGCFILLFYGVFNVDDVLVWFFSWVGLYDVSFFVGFCVSQFCSGVCLLFGVLFACLIFERLPVFEQERTGANRPVRSCSGRSECINGGREQADQQFLNEST